MWPRPGCVVSGRVVQIDPGVTDTASWSGGAYEVAPISEECADKFCDPCWAQQQAPPGAYTVRVASGTAIKGCNEDMCGICKGEDGWCITDGTRVDEVVVEGVLDYPSQTSIELVIQ